MKIIFKNLIGEGTVFSGKKRLIVFIAILHSTEDQTEYGPFPECDHD
jgi:hypothetical protein